VIVVDTSVWVAVLRGQPGRDAHILGELIDHDLAAVAQPVRQELRAGLSTRNRREVLDRLSALPVVVPTEETWARVEQWTDRAAEAGERFGLADLLIASLAQDLGGLVWTRDRDFERMARLNMVQLYAA
jgi:hypothetical protein